MSRELMWDGLYNARDLGGLRTPSGMTEFGRFFRAPRLESLTKLGWEQLVSAGARTIVDLRNDFEVTNCVKRTEVITHHLPIEDHTDLEFMTEWGTSLGSPIYYAENLHRWPDKIAAVFHAMAAAPPGGIVFHCSAGRDRTGLIAAMLLTLAEVPVVDIADDYELSVNAFNTFLLKSVAPHEKPLAPDELAVRVLENRHHLTSFLDALDLVEYLRWCGLRPSEIDSLRERLVGK